MRLFGASPAFKRFEASMNIGYEQWHDGVGYDLDALDELTDKEKRAIEHKLIIRAENDWRDLEALDRLGRPGATEAILRARGSLNVEIRLYAHCYGPPPSQEEWDSAIVYALPRVEPFAGVALTVNCATAHPSRVVVAALWDRVRTPGSPMAFHAARALCSIAGLQESPDDDTHRDLHLRIGGPESTARTLAVQELERRVQASLDSL